MMMFIDSKNEAKSADYFLIAYAQECTDLSGEGQ